MIDLTANISGFFHERLAAALDRHGLRVTPSTEAYLVQLLVEFGSTPLADGWEGTLVERLAVATRIPEPSERFRRFRDIGDRTLYTCGFFLDHLEHRGLSKGYVVAMGGRAYVEAGALARRPSVPVERGLADVYPELADKFERFTGVFDDIRECTALRTPQDIVRVYERWKRTGSQLLAERLEEEGVFPQQTKRGVLH
ncbi:MAG: hypothetical protein KC417_13415 [Myxococcales bacterium]|nr:hypothetical protein [Myxococcales bacterium]